MHLNIAFLGPLCPVAACAFQTVLFIVFFLSFLLPMLSEARAEMVTGHHPGYILRLDTTPPEAHKRL